jgi:hypothetical protein
MQNGNPREMMRECLLAYHSIFPTTTHVLCHWFTTAGGGYEWSEKDGRLKSWETLDESEITSKIESNFETIAERGSNISDSRLSNSYKMRQQIETLQYQFVIDNIDTLLDSCYHIPHIDNLRYTSYLTTDAGIKYCNAFNFPDNIDKEWARILYDFLGFWNYQLNVFYRVGSDKTYKDSISHWPAHALEVQSAIESAKKKLFPVFSNGVTLERHNERLTKLIQEIINESNDK